MTELSAARENVLFRTADFLLDHRRTGEPVADIPEELLPLSEQEAFFVQDTMMRAYDEIGGWKIGARSPDGTPFFAPMPAQWMGANGTLFRGPMHRLHGVEAEIAFQLKSDLPKRSEPYTRDEVLSAIGSCHSAIEVIESALLEPLSAPRESMMADMQMHGGFVAGPAIPNWQDIDWQKEGVHLMVDGSVRVENVASNPGGTDFLRLLTYLANEGSHRTGGLRAEQWITTGSWTGVTWATPSAQVSVEFDHAGSVSLQFAAQPF
ncbi:2-keto-4-pentenoate hydratase [Terriglobus aquaticus]|uniref:2-keto-4-pentenoate hydratase n=1 Tax=Terriglobus aquaticus TaxID=940139 RepID=A0ABW9KI58_9BACT|nr:2-keto-4-pentenoate hydratase [Terriglobus aquaticus]